MAINCSKLAFLRRGAAGLVFTLLVFLQSVVSHGDESAKNPVKELAILNQKAAAARKAADLVRLEELRLERLRILRDRILTGGEMEPDLKPWVNGVLALEKVDGVSATVALLVPEKKISQGYLDNCEYKKAFQELWIAWESFFDGGREAGSPVLGELAIRMFEIVQQAKAVEWGVDNPESKSFIASAATLKKVLETAKNFDPCAVLSIPQLQFLTPPDPAEAFLTADVRTDFKRRQAELVAMSHPLVEVNAAIRPRATDWPVLPVHATTELMKAENLFSLLNDLVLTRPLVRDLPLGGEGKPSYIVPGSIEDLVDRNGERIQLLYGRVLVMKKIDKRGRKRPCIVYLDNSSRRAKWQKLFLNVLEYRPANGEAPAEVGNLLDGELPLQKITLNESEITLYDYPLEYTKQFLGKELHVLRVKDCFELLDTEFNSFRNDPKFLLRQLSEDKNDAVKTHPDLSGEIIWRANENNKARHALVDLFEGVRFLGGQKVLIIVSDDDRSDSEPEWFGGDDEEPPELRTLDGRSLKVRGAGDKGDSFYFELEQPGGNAYFPINIDGVPDAVIASAEETQELVGKARAAGLDASVLVGDIKDVLSGKTRRTPRSLQFLGALVSGGGTAGGEKKKSPLEAFVDETYGLFKQYGFRYIRDERGNIILHQEFANANQDNTNASQDGNGRLQQSDTYAFAVRSPDGFEGIVKPQVYGWEDYKEINGNITNEHLSRVASLHPCLDSVGILARFAARPLVNPSEKPPAWVSEDYKVSGQNVTTSTESNTVEYNEYSAQFVQPKKFVTIERLRSVIGDKATPTVAETLNRLALSYQSLWVPFPRQKWCEKHLMPVPNGYRSTCSRCNAETEAKNGDGKKDAANVAVVNQIDQGEIFNRWITGVEKNSSETSGGGFSVDWGKYDRLKSRFGGTSSSSFPEGQLNTIRGLLVDAARFNARQKKFHNAIVWYNDALEVLETGLPYQPFASGSDLRDLSLLGEVPDTATARNFVGKLRNVFTQERASLALQLELAGVLNSAGKTASALRVFSHVELTAEFYIEPLVGIAKEFFSAYGINADDELRGVVDEIEEVFRVAKAAFRRNGGGESFFFEGLNDQARPDGLKELLEAIDRNAGSADERGNQQVEGLNGIAQAFRSLQRSLSFGDWIRVERRLRSNGLNFGGVGGGLDPLVRTPFIYEADEQRFSHSEPSALFEHAGRAYARFLKDGEQWTPETKDDGFLCYLIGAYWSAQGEVTKAKLSFAAASRVFLKEQADGGAQPAVDRLVSEMNGYWCLVLMESVRGRQDGLRRIGLDFTDGLRGQMFDWSRRWFAAGLHGPAATKQRQFLDYTLRRVLADVGNIDRTRWFFPDYQSELGGPIPDFYLLRFFQQRPLEEIEADNAAIVAKTLEIAKLRQKKAKDDTSGEGEDGQQPPNGEGAPTIDDQIKQIELEIAGLKEKNLAAMDAVLAEVVDKYSTLESIKLDEKIVLGSF